MNRAITLAALAAGLIFAGSAVQAEEAAAPGSLKFVSKNKSFTANGQFNKWKFTKVDLPEGDITKGTVEFEVDIASVEVPGTERLTNHLKQNDMLDAEKFPKATVKIHSASKDGDGYVAKADVSIREITKTVPVKFSVESEKPLKIKGEAVVDRTAFEVYKPFDPADERSVEREVIISIEAEVPEKV